MSIVVLKKITHFSIKSVGMAEEIILVEYSSRNHVFDLLRDGSWCFCAHI